MVVRLVLSHVMQPDGRARARPPRPSPGSPRGSSTADPTPARSYTPSMATTETRLLLLGAVSIFEPVNGYQIRRELLSWGVEDWANIKPGSIYNGLATLAQRGELVRHDLRDGGREVAVYELSEPGARSSARLFDDALTEVRPATAPLAFQTAMSMLPLVTREDARRLLRTAPGEPRPREGGGAAEGGDGEPRAAARPGGDGLLGAGRARSSGTGCCG